MRPCSLHSQPAYGGIRMNTLQAVARILKTEGVEWISCFPSNNLIEAVAQEGIRPIMFRQERGAIMAADGYSRMNNRNKFGVIVTQRSEERRVGKECRSRWSGD